MTVLLGLDADTILTPYAPAIAAAGISAVGRYLKNLEPAEVAALHAAGVAIWLIFEGGSDNVLGGAGQGTEDGNRALAQAQALGAPPTAAIYATADFDIASDQLALALDYWAAFDAVIWGKYQIGGYADGTVLSGLRDHGLPYRWLAGAMGWDGSREFLQSESPEIVQGPTIDGGGSWSPPGTPPIDWPDLGFPYDPDVIFVADCGLWLPSAAA